MNEHSKDSPSGLARLNSLPPAVAEAELRKCCGSSEWARRMTMARPFINDEKLASKAEEIWWSLSPSDWLQAFRSHPKIGERRAAQPAEAGEKRWSEQEQSGMRTASQGKIKELEELNSIYEKRFGYIFVICATGKTPDEMLAALRSRLDHGPEEELRCAAAEQAQITKLRLDKLMKDVAG